LSIKLDDCGDEEEDDKEIGWCAEYGRQRSRESTGREGEGEREGERGDGLDNSP
jgi:hypothetical protein